MTNHRPLRLETFDLGYVQATDAAASASNEAIEAARIAGYDAGYKTGWDDALQQSREEGARIGAEFARNIRDLSFTYHEARAHVLRSLDGFLDELTQTFLPKTVTASLGPMLADLMRALAADAANAPVLIRAAPEEAERLRGYLREDTGLPLQIVDETSLAEGQAYLKLGAEERKVDLSEPLERLVLGIEALRSETERTLDARRSG